jgi:hypothetical protein
VCRMSRIWLASGHRGRLSGGGNHRGSIFRLLLGQALLARGGLTPCKSWGVKSDSSQACTALGIDLSALRMAETPVEKAVTQYVAQMPFLWIGINDDPGPSSLRAAIERNSVALLSNYKREPLDRPSPAWLGHCSDRALVRGSGLWNQQHTEVTHDPKFLDLFEGIIERVGAN